MKALFLSISILMTVSVFAQRSHVIKLQSMSGHTIKISFKDRYASIEVKDEAYIQDAFSELKKFMKHISKTHYLTRIYPLYVISPDNKYFSYPLNRQRLHKLRSDKEKLIARR